MSWPEIEAHLIRTRYSLRDEKGEPLEKTYDEVIDRVRKWWSIDAYTPPEIQTVIGDANKSVCDHLMQKLIVPASPVLMNAGSPAPQKTYFSCFPLGYVGDSIDEIMETASNMASIYRAGGGVGVDLSNLRPRGSLVAEGQGTASGPVSFMNIFNSVAGTLSQGGRRKGALSVALDSHHPNVDMFVKSKIESTLSSLNLALIVHEAEGVRQDAIDAIWHCGEPGIIFLDNAFKNTPIPIDLNPRFINPCAEYMSIANTACNLVSINLPEIVRTDVGHSAVKPILYDRVQEAAYAACIFANLLIFQDEGYPYAKLREETQKYKPVGIGMLGLHGAMMLLGIKYASKEGVEFARKAQAHIVLGSMKASADLIEANPSGTVPCNSEYMKALISDLADVLGTTRELAAIDEAIVKHSSLYNIVTTVQAPTGSVSQLVHSATTGIEPLYALTQTRIIDDKRVNIECREVGNVNTANVEEAHNISPEWQLNVMAAIQEFCHCAISKTVNVGRHFTREDIGIVIRQAHRLGLKSLTIYRDGSKSGQVLTRQEEKQWRHAQNYSASREDFERAMKSKAGPYVFKIPKGKAGEVFAKDFEEAMQNAEPGEVIPIPDGLTFEDVQPQFSAALVEQIEDIPETRAATVHTVSGPITCYVTLTKVANKVREVFINTGKGGTAITAMTEALGRVISIALRHDPNLKARIAKTLRGIDAGIPYKLEKRFQKSIPDAIAYLLSDEDVVVEIDGDVCPECGVMAIRREGGCKTCRNCTYTSC